MRTIRQVHRKENGQWLGRAVAAAPVPDARLAAIQALIPLGLAAVVEELEAEVTRLAGPRYARQDGAGDRVRWGRQRGSVYLADQKLPVRVPRVRDRRRGCEVPLASYAACRRRGCWTRACCAGYWAGWPVASTPPAPRRCRRRSG